MEPESKALWGLLCISLSGRLVHIFRTSSLFPFGGNWGQV